MSILASLASAYDRIEGMPRLGYSMQNIGVVIGLRDDGSVATVNDWRQGEGSKRKPRPMSVPQPVKRTVAIAPNFLWDKTSYVLGVTAGEGKRTVQEHQAFKDAHEKWLDGTSDPGLKALRLFLRQWTPDRFVAPDWNDDLRDENLVFVLESERLQQVWLHERPAAKALWDKVAAEAASDTQVCLVSGERAPVARLHPSIKGVWGGQTAGGSIVSFNGSAYESYGHAQGDNAPVSEAVALKYTAVLNRFLSRDSGHRVQIGDASTVFWADASDAAVATQAEDLFLQMFEPAKPDEEAQSTGIGILLERLREGQQLHDLDPRLARGVRFHVLGLAPNAARISIRFNYDGDFGELAKNYQRFVAEMRIEPPPREAIPPLWRYLVETALLGKRENVPPNLAGEWLRAILTGNRYPSTLLNVTLARIRADGDVNALRAGILRALLLRNFTKSEREAPVAFDPDNEDKGYLLGRLFAVYEQTQSAALGRNVNATIKDKFYGSASATPRNVFPLLERGSANHLAKVGKERPGHRVNIERLIGAIMEKMSPGGDPFPKSLGVQDQALFGLGYYHQRGEFFRKRETNGNEEAL
jgi:CRISPR-associated protein Csd1